MSSAGAQGNGGAYEPAISADGRFVAFESGATTLVAGDTNVQTDVFVRELSTGTTTRVNVTSAGAQATGASSTAAAISADGRFVTFESDAANLVTGDTNGKTDVFVHDRVTGTTTRVSVTSGGAQATDGRSQRPSISADGRFVAFQSEATDLVAGDTNGKSDAFLHDRSTGATIRISVATNGAEATGGDSANAAISADGRVVGFESSATDLVAADTNGVSDVFVRDLTAGTTSRVSLTSAGAAADAESIAPSLSADGRYVTFISQATNLVPGDTNLQYDSFLRDRATGTTTRVSVTSAGAQATNGASYSPVPSADGRYVTFYSYATDLVDGDTNARPDVFLRDRLDGTTVRISLTFLGAQAFNGDSYVPSISADGRFIAYYSDSADIVGGDTNGALDVFVYDQGTN